MRRTSQKWYNMQYINMSGNLPMRCVANLPRVRYSAAYPTGRERRKKCRRGGIVKPIDSIVPDFLRKVFKLMVSGNIFGMKMPIQTNIFVHNVIHTLE